VRRVLSGAISFRSSVTNRKLRLDSTPSFFNFFRLRSAAIFVKRNKGYQQQHDLPHSSPYTDKEPQYQDYQTTTSGLTNQPTNQPTLNEIHACIKRCTQGLPRMTMNTIRSQLHLFCATLKSFVVGFFVSCGTTHSRSLLFSNQKLFAIITFATVASIDNFDR